MNRESEIQTRYNCALWELAEVSSRLSDLMHHQPVPSFWDESEATAVWSFARGIARELYDIADQVERCIIRAADHGQQVRMHSEKSPILEVAGNSLSDPGDSL